MFFHLPRSSRFEVMSVVLRPFFFLSFSRLENNSTYIAKAWDSFCFHDFVIVQFISFGLCLLYFIVIEIRKHFL